MRILFVTYGPHSGIVPFLAAALKQQGAEVTFFNAAEGFDYRMKRWRLPSLHPANLLNSLIAAAQFGRDWRWYFTYTDFAFWWMSRKARRHWRRHQHRYAAALQSGAMFNAAPPAAQRQIPRFLFLDHTNALSRRYQPVPGIPDAKPPSAAWTAREQRTYRDADGVFVMSRHVAASLESDYGVDPGRIHVVGAGPNLDAMPTERAPHDGPPTVLFVGKQFLRKGGPVLMEAFAELRRRLPDARLLVVGPPSAPSAEGVSCLGTLDHREMPEVFARSHLLVLPSWREPFGLAYLEGMAFGLPCIGTRIEAVPEIIEDGVTGLLVAPGDREGLADAMETLLRDRDLAERMGAAGRRRIEQELNWPEVARRVLASVAARVEAASDAAHR